MTFRILTVCTGNICRSPQAELLLRARFGRPLPSGSSWVPPELESAGTMALIGEAMPGPAAELTVELGADPAGHRARQLTAEMIENADLILTLAREHRGAVAKLVPKASRYTFTLREFARVIESASRFEVGKLPGAGDLAGWLTFVTQHRGYVPGSQEDDDVVDPYRRSGDTYRRSALQINSAVETMMARLLPNLGA